ncbi:hypothetical protein FA13DRAFT_1736013 [Coprinellus micaceus]|uniref:Uncharacterized protein n=1 Tax=Coprinellus micaceus TaxID=71717 RepID=A0A4Y7T1T8_COPMI|nr:hypothetical protein FA13DRAFT_1736013 [Coprinellus micaceus]
MYLVVERVPLAEESVPSSEDAGAVLSWLREVPLPHSFPVCRIGGGHIKHCFFPDYEAPLTFSSVDALQRYLSRAFKQLSFAGQRTTKPIDILPERLVLMHPGLNVPLRAGVDTSGAIVLLDLSDFNILPESFLCIRGNGNLNSLARVKADLCMTADPTFGLDDHGHPKKRKVLRGVVPRSRA